MIAQADDVVTLAHEERETIHVLRRFEKEEAAIATQIIKSLNIWNQVLTKKGEINFRRRLGIKREEGQYKRQTKGKCLTWDLQ